MTERNKGKIINWATTMRVRIPTSVNNLVFRRGERRCFGDTTSFE